MNKIDKDFKYNDKVEKLFKEFSRIMSSDIPEKLKEELVEKLKNLMRGN